MNTFVHARIQTILLISRRAIYFQPTLPFTPYNNQCHMSALCSARRSEDSTVDSEVTTFKLITRFSTLWQFSVEHQTQKCCSVHGWWGRVGMSSDRMEQVCDCNWWRFLRVLQQLWPVWPVNDHKSCVRFSQIFFFFFSSLQIKTFEIRANTNPVDIVEDAHMFSMSSSSSSSSISGLIFICIF